MPSFQRVVQVLSQAEVQLFLSELPATHPFEVRVQGKDVYADGVGVLFFWKSKRVDLMEVHFRVGVLEMYLDGGTLGSTICLSNNEFRGREAQAALSAATKLFDAIVARATSVYPDTTGESHV